MANFLLNNLWVSFSFFVLGIILFAVYWIISWHTLFEPNKTNKFRFFDLFGIFGIVLFLVGCIGLFGAILASAARWLNK